MPLQPMHVTAASGQTLFFGKDSVDNYPIAVKVLNGGTFFYDPHSDVFQRLLMEANLAAGRVATGVGSIGVSTITELGTQLARTRQRSGIPGQNSNMA